MPIRKRGNIWYVDYYAYGRRIRERIGVNRKLAEDILRKRKTQVIENRYLDIRRNEKVKFEDFSNTFLESHSKPNKKSWKSDFFNFKCLTLFFGGRYLYEITPKDIEQFKVKRKEKVSSATVNRELATLKTMFAKAIEWGRLEKNPAKNVKFLRENNKRLRYLEKEEIEKLINLSSGYLKSILIVALNTGMRRGEILGLKWHDIDFKRDIIYLLDTKNNDKREVPMNDLAKKALIGVPKHPDSPYIFCRKDGKPYKDIRKSFFTALKKAGIINFRFHDLRHTFASQLVMSGIDLNTVRELMGHKDIEMTLRYAHLSPNHKKHAVEVLARKMVTNWSQEAILEKVGKEQVLQPIDN